MRDLHWLKIDEKSDYKVLLLMFKCLFDEGPAYLSKDFEMLSSIPGKQKLRSSNLLKVFADKDKLKTTEKKIFYAIGSTLWNNFP